LSGRQDPEVHSLARPVEAEVRAIEKVIAWSDHLHICHLSSGQGLNLIERARQERTEEVNATAGPKREAYKAKMRLSCEVTPHHLLLNVGDYKKQGTFLKVNPPLRSQADNDRLWE